jgi:hypothetical protein
MPRSSETSTNGYTSLASESPTPPSLPEFGGLKLIDALVGVCSSDGQDGSGIYNYAFNGTFSNATAVSDGSYRREFRLTLLE